MSSSRFDEFEEYKQRALNNGAFYSSSRARDDGANLAETSRLQARMRMRSSFRGDSSYRSHKRQQEQEMLAHRLATLDLSSKQHFIGDSVISVFGSHEEIDCDFPSPEDKVTSPEMDDQDDDIINPPYVQRQVVSTVRYQPTSPPHHVIMSPSPPVHHRSNSCRVRTRRPRELQQRTSNGTRRRTYSMPSRSTRYRIPKGDDIMDDISDVSDSNVDSEKETFYRIRMFSTSSKGIINRGDSFKKKTLSAQSSVDTNVKPEVYRARTLSNNSQDSSVGSSSGLPPYKVLVMGGTGSGKTSLLRQFMTSEYMGNADNILEGESGLNVSILLDGIESNVEFLDISDAEDVASYGTVDAYVVIYALNERESFVDAVDCLHELRKNELLGTTASILVANKSDIVRGRDVSEEEGKVMAVRYSCKYVEVSAVLNLKVDELLVGIVKQIRLNDKRKLKKPRRGTKSTYCLSNDDTGCLPNSKAIMGKIFKKSPHVFRSCDNLLVL